MTIINKTKLKLSPLDAMRALFRKTITLTTEIDVAAETEVRATRLTVHVKSIMPKAKAGAQAMAFIPSIG